MRARQMIPMFALLVMVGCVATDETEENTEPEKVELQLASPGDELAAATRWRVMTPDAAHEIEVIAVGSSAAGSAITVRVDRAWCTTEAYLVGDDDAATSTDPDPVAVQLPLATTCPDPEGWSIWPSGSTASTTCVCSGGHRWCRNCTAGCGWYRTAYRC